MMALKPDTEEMRVLETLIEKTCVRNYNEQMADMTKLDASDLEYAKLADAWPTNPRTPKLYITYAGVSDYLNCAMTQKVEPFCNPYFRTQLAAQFSNYNATRIKFAGFLKSLGGPQTLETRAMTGDDSGHISINMLDRIDIRIQNGLRTLSRDGYFSGADFGGFGILTPVELKDVLEKPQRSPCG